MTVDYGNYGIFLIMGNAGFLSSTVVVYGRGPWVEKPQSWRLLTLEGWRPGSLAPEPEAKSQNQEP